MTQVLKTLAAIVLVFGTEAFAQTIISGPTVIQGGSGGGVPAGPAFALQFANTSASTFQADPNITINPTTHVFTAPSITLSGLAGSAGNCVQLTTGGQISTTGSPCSTGSANISNGANGVIPLFTGVAAIGAQSHMDDGVTTANTITSTRSFVAPAIGGSKYAALLGSSPTAIASCASGATNQTCVSDPTYASTEQYSLSAMIPNVPSQFHFQDLRGGIMTNFMHDWGYAGLNFGTGAGMFDAFLNDGFVPSSGGNSITHDGHDFAMVDTTPGWSEGSPRNVGSVGWYSSRLLSILNNSNASGILEGVALNQTKYGSGDNAAMYMIVNGFGGCRHPSDECQKPYAGNSVQGTFAATAACATGCTAGSTQVTSTPIIGGGPFWGTGRMYVDSSNSPTVTSVTNIAASTLGPGSTITVAATVPVSNAWGTLSANCVVARNTTPPTFATSQTCSVTVVGGTGFDTTHLICFKSLQGLNQSHECTIPTAVANPTGPTATVTMPLRFSHSSGTYLFQGGMAGYGLENIWATTVAGGGILNNLRYLFDVVGSTSTSTIEVGQWVTTGFNFVPFNHTIYDFANLSTLSNSGTTVTATVAGGGTLSSPSQYNKGKFIIAGSTGGALDGTCTNVVFTNTLNFTCTIAGLTGSHTSVSATATLASSAGIALNAINLWPMAEVIDVQNESLTPPAPDGTLTFEPNIVNPHPGDTLEETQDVSMKIQGETLGITMNNPFGITAGLAIGGGGRGMVGGQGGPSAPASLAIGMAAPDTEYVGQGGTQLPPNAIGLQGAYYLGVSTVEAPTGGAFLSIGTSAVQRANVNYTVSPFVVSDASSASLVTVTPNSGNMLIQTPGVMTYLAASHVFNGPVTIPTGSTLPNTGVTAGTYTFPTLTLQADGRVSAASSANTSSSLSIGSLQAGEVSLGGLSNLVGDSTNLTAGTWHLQANITATAGQTDPYGGTQATQFVSSGVSGGTINNGGTTLTSGNPYTVCFWGQGGSGGELINASIGGATHVPSVTLTSGWVQYGPFVLSPTTLLTQTVQIQPAGGTGITYNIAFPTVVAGSLVTCPAKFDTSGTSTGAVFQTIATPQLNISAPQTTVNCSTSGTAVFSQPLQGTSDKKVVIHLAACNGTASYTFPTAFINTPSVFASNNVAAAIATSVSTSAVTVTGAPSTGALILEDY